MKHLKSILPMTALVALAFASNAQSVSPKRTAYNNDRYHNSYTTNKVNGKVREQIRTDWNDKVYQIELLNGKLTSLTVDGAAIPQANWSKYGDTIAAIRLQIKVDREQADRDMQQARRDQQQARRDMQQAHIDRQLATRDAAQAAQDRAVAKRDQVQAMQEQIQAKQDEARDQAQAKRDQEQAAQDQIQAKRDQEQAHLDRIQADKDRRQAEEDAKLVKNLVNDLVSDKIIGSEKALKSLTLNSTELIVNGQKQPADVQKRYAEKYSRFSSYNLTIGDDGSNHQGVYMRLEN
jgi:colicin import membrane protein